MQTGDMTWRPVQLTKENASSFDDVAVVACYPERPRYCDETITILEQLAGGRTGRALDIGTGLGELSRRLAPRVDSITAIDLSPLMIERARELAAQDCWNVEWRVGKFEDVGPQLTGSYDLIFGGDSLHWLDWPSAFSLFRTLLSPNGMIACVSRPFASDELKAVILPLAKKYTYAKEWEEYSLKDIWSKTFGFQVMGEKTTQADVHRKTVEQWITAWHSMSTLTRSRLGGESSAAFDNEARTAVRPFERDGIVAMAIENHVWWGRHLL